MKLPNSPPRRCKTWRALSAAVQLLAGRFHIPCASPFHERDSAFPSSAAPPRAMAPWHSPCCAPTDQRWIGLDWHGLIDWLAVGQWVRCIDMANTHTRTQPTHLHRQNTRPQPKQQRDDSTTPRTSRWWWWWGMPCWCTPAAVLSMRRQQPKISLELRSQSSARLVLVIRLRLLLLLLTPVLPPLVLLLAAPILLERLSFAKGAHASLLLPFCCCGGGKGWSCAPHEAADVRLCSDARSWLGACANRVGGWGSG